MTTFGMPSLLWGRSEGLGEDADPNEYAQVCVFGVGMRRSAEATHRLSDQLSADLRWRISVALCGFQACGRCVAPPRRVPRLEDPLEGNGRQFGDATHRALGTFEAAQDDLVLAHEQRAEVPNDLPVNRQLIDAGIGAFIEGDEVGLLDTGPEALGQVFGPFHVSTRMGNLASATPPKAMFRWRSASVPYRFR